MKNRVLKPRPTDVRAIGVVAGMLVDDPAGCSFFLVPRLPAQRQLHEMRLTDRRVSEVRPVEMAAQHEVVFEVDDERVRGALGAAMLPGSHRRTRDAVPRR